MIAAVSTRKIVPGHSSGIAPAAAANATSSLVNPPSGPTSTIFDGGSLVAASMVVLGEEVDMVDILSLFTHIAMTTTD